MSKNDALAISFTKPLQQTATSVGAFFSKKNQHKLCLFFINLSAKEILP
ncbi:TPA: hypothetical protein ACY4VV_002037 [Streptococcus pyogenes]|nr:hypothetical protein [Streptococcus pyogenes]HER4777262.1 hypothetical protein [Streptococcus pyogenes NGAS169]HEQ0233364.1 hypothetical protein [Streptococcus pyogenes]HEQ5973422.1 hypothetical protein [Streptococcus pyogenes]HEQ5974364.1 hypothetical protein [Streptococcus pyogenes]